MEIIGFWSPKQPCFWLSNFYLAPFELKGKKWKTSEHYYQAMKVEGTESEELIRLAKTPREAAQLGRSVAGLDPNWEEKKELIMKEAILGKFSQNENLKQMLLETGDNALAEVSPKDYYWGVGANGSGKNRLGWLLMELRDELRSGV